MLLNGIYFCDFRRSLFGGSRLEDPNWQGWSFPALCSSTWCSRYQTTYFLYFLCTSIPLSLGVFLNWFLNHSNTVDFNMIYSFLFLNENLNNIIFCSTLFPWREICGLEAIWLWAGVLFALISKVWWLEEYRSPLKLASILILWNCSLGKIERIYALGFS